MKTIHLLRHTANEGDALTDQGIADAVAIGRRLDGGYAMAVSSGAQRATQTIACILSGLGAGIAGGVAVVPALRSSMEDRWRQAYRDAGAGDLGSLRTADPDLVAADSATLAGGLREIFSMLAPDTSALAVGHSPTNEAAVYGLTGTIIAPLGRGEGVAITEAAGTVCLDRL